MYILYIYNILFRHVLFVKISLYIYIYIYIYLYMDIYVYIHYDKF